MAMTINTNIQSLNAQRNLGTSQSSLSTSMQRLSSGLRINSAKDDAAGLAIAERMSAQVRGLNQAQRNANDGVSLAQTAEGALSTIGGNLQRIRELAVQSRNATNSTEDRAALQKEVDQLKEEIDRVATTTSFNGTKLLNGSFTDQEFQVGANQGQVIKVGDFVNAQIDKLGTWSAAADVKTYSNAAGTGPTIADDKLALSFDINGVTIGVAADTSRTTGQGVTALKAAFDTAVAANPEKLKGMSMDAAGKITVANADQSASISNLVGMTALALGTETVTTVVAKGASQTGFDKLDVSTIAGSDNAIVAMDAALKDVNSARADLGAIQNRFESVVSNLSVNSENLSASKSRIMDADFASETANLSRSQILQQAGTAMVAQANQLPQGVLSLLR
ncbi:flagellin [Comamonas thiooxydans]|uniref:flagellin n=1 Tax=Comamonas thiooxydans TaxID=363952 RepID=UPI0001BB0D17|nr:flagellin [Comamonas thiooxydans]ACY31198.1 flagellin-like protein [Comamonas thiooxydans]MDO1474944.1 flagellin [Comamonas thiooxydans]